MTSVHELFVLSTYLFPAKFQSFFSYISTPGVWKGVTSGWLSITVANCWLFSNL